MAFDTHARLNAGVRHRQVADDQIIAIRIGSEVGRADDIRFDVIGVCPIPHGKTDGVGVAAVVGNDIDVVSSGKVVRPQVQSGFRQPAERGTEMQEFSVGAGCPAFGRAEDIEIITGTSLEPVAKRTAIEHVTAFTAYQGVEAAAAAQHVTFRAAEDTIIESTSDEDFYAAQGDRETGR